MRKTVADYCFVFGASSLFFFLCNITLAAVIFLFRGSESALGEWISVACVVPFVVIACKRTIKEYVFASIFTLIALAAIFMGGLVLGKSFYDISYDGQTYQQEGVIQLAQGWNPVYQNLDPAVIGLDQKWINYYPKGIWIVESYFYLLTHDLQAAKGLNAILVVVSAALLYAAFTDAELLGPWSALAVSVLAALSPVNLVQSLNFYVDGDLYSVFLCVVAIALSWYAKKRPLALVAFFSAILLLINIKFTGLVDVGLLLIVLFVVLIRQSDSKLFLAWFEVSVAAVIVGILFIGASPYITNTLRYHAPFYPLFGKGAIDLKPYNVPGNFIDKNSAEIFFLSFFSRSATVRGVGTTASYKMPFTYDGSELAAFHYPDPEEGGFGPLFGGIILFAFFALIASGIRERRRGKSAIFWHAWLAIIFVIIICAIDPIASLARYVPQAYLIPIIVIMALFALKRPFATQCAVLLAALLLFNNYLVGESYVEYNVKASEAMRATLSGLAVQSERQPVLIHFNEFKSDRIMFQEAGISYETVGDPADCRNAMYFLPDNTTQLCEN